MTTDFPIAGIRTGAEQVEESPPVIIRRSVRHDVSMRAAVRLAPEHAGTVRFTPAAGSNDGWLEANVVDFSTGGVGLMTTFFVPRRSVLLVRVFGSDASAPPLVEAPCRVQRVCMTDRRPAYLLGTSFESMANEAAEQVNAVLNVLSGTT